jgi:hypothetical protein
MEIPRKRTGQEAGRETYNESDEAGKNEKDELAGHAIG